MSIQNLEPKVVWNHFYSLTQIPRPSKHEEAIRAFMVDFGKKLGLETIMDEVGNVIIKKPATAGMENRKGVILQGHLDMVPQKNSDTAHNFVKDPITAYIDGEWVTAQGTTLGADNGMGVAATMAVLEAKDLVHGPIEALFTADEETGMTGAFGLKAGVLNGDILMNLDSEDEGELYVGCAGGTDANASSTYTETAIPQGYVAYKLSVIGLKGGHSGVDIHLGRANSNKLMFRYLKHTQKHFDLKIAEVLGGSLRNAIPRETFAKVVVPEAKAADFEKCVSHYEGIFKAEFKSVEPSLELKAEKIEMPKNIMDSASQKTLINVAYVCPNGVMRMSNDMQGLVETSMNMAIVVAKGGKIKIQSLLRSSVDSAKEALEEKVASSFELAGYELALEGRYPGWKPNMDSPILKTMQGIYQNMYGNIPKIMAIHAGLECGLLGGVYPNWDMISFGPTIRFPHSPDEKVKIDTVVRFWDFLVETLKNVPVK